MRETPENGIFMKISKVVVFCVCMCGVSALYVLCVCEKECLSIHLSSGRLGEETLWSLEFRGQVQVFPAPSIPPALLRSREMDRIRERREGMGRRGHEPEVIDWHLRWGTVGTDIHLWTKNNLLLHFAESVFGFCGVSFLFVERLWFWSLDFTCQFWW